MTAALPLSASPSPAAAAAVGAGRVLSGVIGGFLALEGLSRLIWSRALVAPSEAASGAEPSLHLLIGGSLCLGAVLHQLRPTRLWGTALLLLGLAGPLSVEVLADDRSPDHLLFWIYVGVLLLASHGLRGWRGPRGRFGG